MAGRDVNWWLLSPEDAGHELDHLLEAVRGHDWAVFEDSTKTEPPVALAIAESADGRLACVGLLVGLNEAYVSSGQPGESTEVTSRDLRSIPVAELIGRAVHSAPVHSRWAARLATDRAPKLDVVRRAPGPKGHPDEHFQMVASLYRQALTEQNTAPVAWMTRELNADRSTVTRWIQRARDKGYLGRAIPGRAGEQPIEDPS